MTFRNITCDPTRRSSDLFQKEGININKRLENCNYNSDSKTLSCSIVGSFYTNNLFGDYYFNIGKKGIYDENGNLQLTFASNRLNETDFTLTEVKAGLKYFVSIYMKNKYFYFPLITHLTNYKSGQSTPINLYRENT